LATAKNTNSKGNVGLGRAINYFTSQYRTVLLPLNDCQPYDIAIDINEAIQRVSVKTTSHKGKTGDYIICLSTRGGTSRKTKPFDITAADLLFILADNNDCWLIPTKSLTTLYSLTLNQKQDKYRVH